VIRLADVQGQARAVETLRRALGGGKLPHAYLYAGPAGVGKATTARALAAALNCETAPGQGCGECTPCTKIDQQIHPDVLTVTPQGKGEMIVIDQVRELITRLGYPPHEARARVVILEDADRLNPSAANAFLKTLEEPPARTHFVLVTTAPDRLLITIRSRCHRVRFAPLGQDAIAAILARAGVEASRARAAAAMAGGSATRGAELAEGETLERRRAHADAVIRAAAGTSVRAAVEAANALAQDKEDLVATLELVALWYRDAAAVAAGVPEDRLVHRDAAAALREEAARSAGPPALARRAAKVLEAQTALLTFANPQLTLEHMILSLRAG
jgi:DNA polymerase-3 subunit delta'